MKGRRTGKGWEIDKCCSPPLAFIRRRGRCVRGDEGGLGGSWQRAT